MKLVEGSADGINWVPYAMKTNDSEARAAASRHDQVDRI